jgi:hypothetical protein
MMALLAAREKVRGTHRIPRSDPPGSHAKQTNRKLSGGCCHVYRRHETNTLS